MEMDRRVNQLTKCGFYHSFLLSRFGRGSTKCPGLCDLERGSASIDAQPCRALGTTSKLGGQGEAAHGSTHAEAGQGVWQLLLIWGCLYRRSNFQIKNEGFFVCFFWVLWTDQRGNQSGKIQSEYLIQNSSVCQNGKSCLILGRPIVFLPTEQRPPIPMHGPRPVESLQQPLGEMETDREAGEPGPEVVEAVKLLSIPEGSPHKRGLVHTCLPVKAEHTCSWEGWTQTTGFSGTWWVEQKGLT